MLNRKMVQCPICNTQTFNTVCKCKCGYKFPYDPIQDEIVVDICSNCGQIKQYRNGEHIGGDRTICPLCKKGALTTLGTPDEWIKMSEDEKQKIISMVYTKKSCDSTLCKPTVECPYCNSTNTRKIGDGERVVSVLGLGLLSNKINKSFKCKNCGGTF